MRTLTIEEIRNAVMNLMDENGGDPQFMSSDDANKELYGIISTVTENAVQKIHLQAPSAFLDGRSYTTFDSAESTLVYGKRVFKGRLPKDFFRLVSCKLRGWHSPVTTLVWEDSSEYAKQGNRYLMGNASRPIAALVHRGNEQWVEMYSTDDGQAIPVGGSLVEHFIYLQKPTLTENQSGEQYIDVCSRLYWPCIYQIAADTLKAVNEAQKAQMFEAMAERYFATYGNKERIFPDNGTRIEK